MTLEGNTRQSENRFGKVKLFDATADEGQHEVTRYCTWKFSHWLKGVEATITVYSNGKTYNCCGACSAQVPATGDSNSRHRDIKD